MESKKILFIADAKSIHTAKWVNYFIGRGYKVYLATYASENVTSCKDVFFLSTKESRDNGGNYHYLLSVKRLAKIINHIEPDYINAHFSYSMGFVSFLAITIARSKASFSIVCHGSDILAPPLPFISNKINKFLVRRAGKIFSVSDQIKDKLVSFHECSEKIFVGQYGIDIDCQVLDVKKDIDIVSNRSYIENSNIDFMLEELAKIKDAGLVIVFVLPYISNKKLAELKLSYPFIVFYSELSYAEMQKLVSRSKVYISATKSDGTSLSLLEAMSSGSIPVVSNIVSNRSWVLDNVNGFLFNTKDEFISKVKQALIGLPNNAKNINRELIVKKSTYSVQMQKIESFLVN